MKGLTLFVVCLLLAVYVVIGGIIFHFLEQKTEETSAKNLLRYKQQILADYTCMNAEELEKFARAVITAYDNGVFTINGNTTSGNNWGFNSAIFFATTVVTTIGYGHISPITSGGRIFCCLFAVIGIPLFLVAAGGVGERIVRLSKALYNKVSSRHAERHPRFASSISTLVLLLISFVLFMLIPAGIFTIIEPWNYGESLYFCFITMTTIGFGDYVPGGTSDFADRGWYRLCVSGYILVGLAWMASIIAHSQGLFLSAVNEREGRSEDNEVFQLNDTNIQKKDYGANGGKE